MAQIARNNEAEKATDNVAELGKRTADKGADVAREAIDRTENTARRGFEFAQRTAGAALEVERAVTRRSTEGATEVGQAFAELVKEQARHNVEAFQALTRAVDWDQVARIQSELRAHQLGAGGDVHPALLRGGAGGDDLGCLGDPGAGPQGGLTSSPPSRRRP